MVTDSALYCGLDLSTQQLKLTVIDGASKVFVDEAVNFDRDLPQYGTTGGANVCGLESTAPTLMWVEAMDVLFQRLKDAGFPFSRVAAISGCGQQHGSVYWRSGTEDGILRKLNPAQTLRVQLDDAFSVVRSPIWQDSSTGKECAELERAAGGPEALAKITGSSAYERFTGSQIMKFARKQPDAYRDTERISLVSSFVPSMLLGQYASIDVADGSGMNLLDIGSKDWDDRLLAACGPDARRKLGSVVQTTTVLGRISNYFVERYGLHHDCRVVAFTGDNPDSLASLNLSLGDVVVSLGTSDTLFFPLTEPHPSTEGHVLCHPTREDAYMAMIVYKNGSLVRERIRDDYAAGTWEQFDAAVARTPVGCGGRTGFFFVTPEITPRASGVFRFERAAAAGGEGADNDGRVQEFSDPAANPRALLESQLMSMRSHARRVGYSDSGARGGRRIVITGGASANDAIARVVGDVFGATVVRSSLGSGSAALGGAYRARFAARRDAGDIAERSYEEDVKVDGTEPFVEVCRGDEGKYKAYTELLERYEALEARVCELGRF